MTWVKSSFCNNSACAEVSWQSSSFCAGGECAEICQGGACAEVASSNGDRLIRSSERPDQVVRLSADEWDAFVKGVRAGEFG